MPASILNFHCTLEGSPVVRSSLSVAEVSWAAAVLSWARASPAAVPDRVSSPRATARRCLILNLLEQTTGAGLFRSRRQLRCVLNQVPGLEMAPRYGPHRRPGQ